MTALTPLDGPDAVHNRALARIEFGKYGDHSVPLPAQVGVPSGAGAGAA